MKVFLCRAGRRILAGKFVAREFKRHFAILWEADKRLLDGGGCSVEVEIRNAKNKFGLNFFAIVVRTQLSHLLRHRQVDSDVIPLFEILQTYAEITIKLTKLLLLFVDVCLSRT